MKTNFINIDGKWFAPLGKMALSNCYVLGALYLDVCNGKKVVVTSEYKVPTKIGEKNKEELTYKVNEFCRESPDSELVGYEEGTITSKLKKKDYRNERVDSMCGVYWDFPTGLKKIGKTRRLRRRMWPNKTQWKEYNSYLPF